MRLDKKATAGALRFVLWRGAGQAEITAGVEEGDVIAAMQALPSVPVPPPPVQSPSP
jgi:3-dehydroquinate synthase